MRQPLAIISSTATAFSQWVTRSQTGWIGPPGAAGRALPLPGARTGPPVPDDP